MAQSYAQLQRWDIQGTVYDYTNKRPVEAVTVLSTSGGVAITDTLGKYRVPVRQGDSIWFSYLGKNTMKYRVDTIENTAAFEIALHVDIHLLPEVRVRSSNYKFDSVQNRLDYAKIFNYRKPRLTTSSNPPSTYTPGSLTVGLDLDAIIDMFRVKKMRSMMALQKRLLQQEQDKYIDHRFTKRLVRQLTNADSTNVDIFMNTYRPSYELLQLFNDLELGYYIQQSYKNYIATKRRRPVYPQLRF
ncbi:peptidase associated/transthyretin-like domain-containing protein [Deminuibacter soli]|uniref:Carboxypeptidase-like regulatory domain-containing protein n=1 Tax=Deminuibacter soli TaxID=2291815 RepID=A0A3E1NQY5_9BACT|nr:hypothetical protein [Deminuibacter soli]RFM30317.1 hypothetical protein DXN05_04980 [Deminuibacter soli]